MFVRSIVLAIVILFLSLPLPMGSSAIAAPCWPTASSVSTSFVMPVLSITRQMRQAGHVWQVQQRLSTTPHFAIASTPRPIASMSYPVKRAIPRILNSLMHTIVQCFRQFL